jgi:uncharacterized membrane protein YqjE
VSEISPGGLSGALARLGASALALVRTRLELAALEFSEGAERRKSWALLVGVAAVAFGFALLAASAFVVVLFWDTHRLPALAGLAIVYLLIGFVALWRIDVRQRTDPRPFTATLAELERDRQWLAGQVGDRAEK